MAEARREVLNFQTVNELSSHFAAKVSSIRIALQLRGNDGSCKDIFLKMSSDVLDLKLLLKQIRNCIEKGKEDLIEADALRSKIRDITFRTEYCLQHMPNHIPKLPQTKQVVCTPMKEIQSAYDYKENQEPKDVRVQANGKKPKELEPPVPMMRYLTLEEYNSIPKYIKGRVTYDAMNAAVDDFNKTLKAKYKLLSKPRANVGHHDMKRYKEFKSQENKDTLGLYFCISDDLKTYSNFKVDNAGKSILISLRHCGMLREIRGPGNLIRYCVIT